MKLAYLAVSIIATTAMLTLTTQAEEGKTMLYALDAQGRKAIPQVAVRDVCAWPNLTLLPNGDVVAMIYNQPSHGQMPGDVECWVTQDKGDTWTRRSVAAPRGTPTQNRMNVAAGLMPDGKLILITSGWSEPGNPDAQGLPKLGKVLPAAVCISSDEGKTWTIHEDHFPNGPDGRPMIPFGDIMTGKDGKLRVAAYSPPVDPPPQEKVTSGNLPLRAAAGQNWVVIGDGHTWEEPIPMTRRPKHNETALFHLGDGHWLAAARRAGLLLQRSEDDGHTWTRGEKITDNLMHPGHLTRLGHGDLLLSYGNRVRPTGVEVRFSSDEGHTWSDPIRLLNTNSPDSGYPSSVAFEDGSILTACYARGIADHPGYHMFSIRWDPAVTRRQLKEKALAR